MFVNNKVNAWRQRGSLSQAMRKRRLGPGRRACASPSAQVSAPPWQKFFLTIAADCAVISKNYIANRGSGDNGSHDPPESLRWCESGGQQTVKWTAEGAGERVTKYSATWGIRQLPGICWYPAKGTAFCREARWHRELKDPSLTAYWLLGWVFLYRPGSAKGRNQPCPKGDSASMEDSTSPRR